MSTLHLIKQTNPNNLPWMPAYHENPKSKSASNNKSASLYSNMSNAFSRTAAMIHTSRATKTSSSRSKGKQIKTKAGDVTIFGLACGYIQASPFYPTTTLHIESEHGTIFVKGFTESGKHIFKSFDTIGAARTYLKTTK